MNYKLKKKINESLIWFYLKKKKKLLKSHFVAKPASKKFDMLSHNEAISL